MRIPDDKAAENMGFEKMERLSSTRFYFQKFDRDNWEKATKSTLKTRIILTLLAIGLLVATVVDYIYLGGYEAIISGEMPGVMNWFDYVVEIGCLLVMPVLATVFLRFGLGRKKKSKHVERLEAETSVYDESL